MGLKTAIEQTVEIAKHLPNKQDKKLYKKTIHSIFDDQMQAHTTLNRGQRRGQIKNLDARLKELLK